VAIREPLGDLYEELGVARDASRDEIAAAYRARAKELHPDTQPIDADAASRFARVGAAYRVLSDPAERARYDESLCRTPPPAPTPTAPPVAAQPAPAPAKPQRLSRKGARWCAWGGAALAGLGLVVGAFVVSLERHEADLRANGVTTTAVVVPVSGGQRRLEFETVDGARVLAKELVKTGEEAPAIGSRVRVHYDPDDPTNIVTDESHTGRDVTLWIVAVKFVLGGAVLMWFGVRALRRMAST
jgi:hypothetical protein